MILFRIGRLHAQGVGNRQRNHLELEVIQNPISDPGFNIFENGSLCHSTPITISVIPTLEIGFRIRPSEMPRTFQAIRGQNPGHPEGGGVVETVDTYRLLHRQRVRPQVTQRSAFSHTERLVGVIHVS